MNKLAVTVLLTAAVGCARVAVTQVDYTDRTFVTCGNRWASRVDLDSKAFNTCRVGSAPVPLQCGAVAYGSMSDSSGYAYNGGQSYSGTTVTVPLSRLCCRYQCRDGAEPRAIQPGSQGTNTAL